MQDSSGLCGGGGQAGAKSGNLATILVAMPFYSALAPSYSIGLLAAIGKTHGFSVDTAHLTLEFASRVGLDIYEELCNINGDETGQWLFSPSAFSDSAPDRDDQFPYHFPHVLAKLRALDVDEQELCRIRHELVPQFLSDAEELIDWSRYRVVGFTSTFQQNTPALALARRLKERFPHLVILFGGNNFAGEMGRELVRRCSWIDYAIDGEADRAFPELLRALSKGVSPSYIGGVISHDGMDRGTAQPVADMNGLPLPDYDEYFARAERLGILSKGERTLVHIPFETSRGCWWGQKHHCTFCGLNSEIIGFREKSTDRVLSDMAGLAKRYGMFRFVALDNIMPRRLMKELLPALKAERRNYDIFFNTKSNLTRADVRALRGAGIRYIQPGIESFNSHVLKIMRKGVRAIQNINLLRWARYYGVRVNWNILWGFPGEHAEYYEEQAKLIPNIVHLEPPYSRGGLTLCRFSPFYLDREKFGIRRLEPGKIWSYVYPSSFRLERIAYNFEHEFENELPDKTFEPLREAVDVWKDSWTHSERPWFHYRWSPGLLHIEDGRNPEKPSLYSFEAPLAEIYVTMSDRPITAQAIRNAVDPSLSVEEIAEVLDLFVLKGLAVRDDDLFLALAIPAQN